MRAWWLGVAAAGGLIACAPTKPAATGGEAVVVSVTPAERVTLDRARQRLAAAETRRAEAGTAIAESQRFLANAANEAQFAARSLAQARAAVLDGTPTAGQALLAGAAADKAYAAALAKRDYAWWLVDDRRARFDEAEAERRLARADLDAAELDIAQRAHRAAGLSATAILDEQQTAARQLAAARTRTQQRAGQVAESRDAWEALQRQSDTAARDVQRYEQQPEREQRP
ncbi:MAG TPA: hypothetical protein VF334_13045 [Polyangia bacterium]